MAFISRTPFLISIIAPICKFKSPIISAILSESFITSRLSEIFFHLQSTDVKLTQPQNAFLAIDITLPGIVIVLRLTQSANAFSPIALILYGIVTTDKLLQPLNVSLPITFNLDPSVKITSLNLEQFLNAASSISSTLFGIIILNGIPTPEKLEHAPAFIFFTPSSNVIAGLSYISEFNTLIKFDILLALSIVN